MADEQIVTNIVANADFSNLIGDLNKVTVALSRMQSELKSTQRSLGNQIRAINTQFGETLRSTGQFTSHFVTISSDVEKFGRSLDSGKMKLGQYFKVWQDHHRTAGGLIRDLAKQQVQMQNAVLQPIGKNAEGMMRFAVHVPKGLDLIRNKTALTRQELAIMNKVVQDGAQQLINWGKNTQWAGRQLTVGLTVPLVAFGKAAADAFRAADQELVRLTKVYGDLGETTTANLAQVRKEVIATARELSTTMGVSFKDTIALGADIAATGKQGNELLSSISETTRLAVLGEVDRQDAMKATLAIQSAFKANTEELAESINFLNAVENQTSTTLNDLVEAIPKAGPVIKGLGGSVQDLALYLTAMREGGINATEGANALKSALASLINPTDVAVKKFEGFGIDLLGIVNNNAGNVTKTLLTLQSALDQLDPLAKQQAIEQLFGKFQFSRLNALFENLGKQGSQTLQVLDLMKASSEDLANIAGRELAAVTESASGKYRRALETLKADLAQTGEQFLNIATKVINATDKIINFINNLPEPMKKILGLAGGFTALVGPLIMLTGVLGNFFGYIVKGVYHFKALFKGAEGWKLLTPEIMAANNAGTLIEKTFYSDAKAAAVLHKAILDLTAQYNGLAEAAARAAIGTGAVSTTAGNPVIVSTPGGGKRIVDPTHPLAGREGTRSFAHMVPRKTDQPGSIFGVVQSSGPVNTLVGENPMIYAADDLPNIPGLTTIERSVKTAAGRQPMAVSTGVVIDEVAKQHALMAALAMQGKQELIEIEDTLKNSGMLTVGFMQTFDDILPETSRIAKNAAAASQAIIAEVQAGKLTVEQARAKIIQLNIAVEQEIIETMSLLAASRGAAFDPYTIPLLSQPSITAAGKSNMKELFHKENTRDLVNQIATLLGVRTSGAGYNLETTTPVGARRGYRQLPLPGFIGGGQIADGVYTLNDGNIVPGPKHINRDIQFGILPVDSFVVNQGATKKNLEFLQGMVGEKNNLTGGGQPVMLSPFEFVVPPEVVNEGNNLDILKGINSGQITFSNTGGKIPALQYFAAVNAGRRVARKVTPLKVTLPKSKVKKIEPGWRGGANATRTDTWNLKPASGGVYGVDKPGTNTSGVNDRLGKSGASASEYLESLKQAAIIKGSGNPVVGTTDDFLEALVLAGKISRSEANDILKSLSKTYVAKVKEMSVITDPTNPYHELSEKAIIDSAFAAKILPWWKQFKVKTGSIEKNRPAGKKTGSGASGTPTSTILVVDGEVVKVKPFEGSRGDSIKALHGANKDWADFVEESLGTGVRAALAGGLIQKFAAFMPGRKVQKKVGPEFEEEFPDWVIRNEKTNLSNTDPLHGPLQIGRYQPPLTIRTRRQPAGIMYRGRYTKSIWQGGPKKGEAYWSPRHTSKVEAFLTGDEAARANYIIEEYMRGAYSVMGLKGAAEALRAAAKKVSGRFYRGITLGGRSRVGGTMSALPDWLEQELELARKTGDFSGVIGREFILRRSSWSENPKTAGGFGDFFITADVKNRNAVKASEMFPDLRFPDPRTGEMLPVNESESFFGGKFRIVKASKDGMYVQSVNSPMGGNRAMGGDVNAGTPYIVGENGPEVFIPRQSGGIIPNNMMQYKFAGGGIKAIWNAIRGVLSRGKTTKAPAPTAAGGSGQMELDLGVPAAAADDLAGPMSPFGFKGQMIGLGGSLAGGAIGNSVAGMPGMMVGSMIGNMAMFLPQLLKAKSLVGGIGQLLSKLFWPAALITGAIALGKWLLDLKKKYEDLGKANRLAFGGTKESFESVGIKNYKTMSDRIKDINEQLELHRAKVKSVYESYTKTGVSGLSLTIEELRKAIENAKTNQKEYVEAFNNIDSGKVVQYAAQLKAQFVAMGMSAQEATNQIYAIVKASEKAGQAFAAITSKGFTSIQTNIDGIKFIVDYLSDSLGNTFNVEEFNVGLDTLLNSVLAYKNSLVGVEDDQKNIRDEADATAETLEKISKIQGAQSEISKEQLDALKSQNIIYAGILGNAETLESITAKILLYSSGLQQVVDLNKMSAEAAIALANNFATVQNVMNEVTEDINKDKYRNSLEPLSKIIKTVKDDSDKAAEAVKRLKKVDEDYYRDKMKAIDDLIKKLQKERDERLKLIDLQERASTFENQMKSAQIKYQQSLTAGNLAQAAQEQLNINQLSSERQRQLLRDSINDKYTDEIDKLQEQKDRLQDELDKANKNYNAKTAAASEKAAELAKLESYRDELELIALRNINGPINKTDSNRIDNIFKEMMDAGGELRKAAITMREANPAQSATHPKGTGKSFSQVLIDNLNADVKLRSGDNKTFADAVAAFAKAVDEFKGGTSPAYFEPGKGEKNDKSVWEVLGAVTGASDTTPFDTSVMVVKNPKTSKKYYIPLDSPRFKDTYEYIVSRGYHFDGWQKTMPEDLSSVYMDPKKLPKLATGGYVKGYSKAGQISGQGGTGTSDDILIRASQGEFMINANSAANAGMENLHTINQKGAQGIVEAAMRILSGSNQELPKYDKGGGIFKKFSWLPQAAGSAMAWTGMENLEGYLSRRWGANENASGFSKWARALGRLGFNTLQGGVSGTPFGGGAGFVGGSIYGLVEGLIGLAQSGSEYGVKGGSKLGGLPFGIKGTGGFNPNYQEYTANKVGKEMLESSVYGMLFAGGLKGLGKALKSKTSKQVGSKVKQSTYEALAAATIGLKPLAPGYLSPNMPKLKSTTAAVETFAGPGEEAAFAINQMRYAGDASKNAVHGIIAAAEKVARSEGRFAPTIAAPSIDSLKGVSRILFKENLDRYNDDILSWPWRSAIKKSDDLYSNQNPKFWEQLIEPEVISKLSFRQKKALAKLAGIDYKFGKGFPKITLEQIESGYEWFYKNPEMVSKWGNWENYKSSILESVGLDSPLLAKENFMDSKKAQDLKNSLENIRLKNEDGTDSGFFKYTLGSIESDPRWSTAFGSNTSVVKGGKGDRGYLMLGSDLGKAAREQYLIVYEDLIKRGFIRRARYNKNGKRIEDKDLAPLPYSPDNPLQGTAMTFDEFLVRVSSTLPDVTTSMKGVKYRPPSPFIQSLNESYVEKVLGMSPLQKFRFYHYDIYGSILRNEKGEAVAAGYYSLDKGFDYATNPGSRIGMDPSIDPNSIKGLYSIDLLPKEIPSPVFAGGGFSDEFAILVPEELAKAKSRLVAKHSPKHFTKPMTSEFGRGLRAGRFYKPGKGWSVTKEQADEGLAFGVNYDTEFPALADLLNSGKIKTSIPTPESGKWDADSLIKIVREAAQNKNAIIKDGTRRTISQEWLNGIQGSNYSALESLLRAQEIVNLARKYVQNLPEIDMLQPVNSTKKSVSVPGFAEGGYIKKFHDLRGPIPGPYNAEVGALVRAKTESIYPTGYVESLQNATMSGGNTYVLKNEIHASEGMDVNQLADVVTKRTIDTIKSIDSVNLKSTGTNRKFGGMIPA